MCIVVVCLTRPQQSLVLVLSRKWVLETKNVGQKHLQWNASNFGALANASRLLFLLSDVRSKPFVWVLTKINKLKMWASPKDTWMMKCSIS